MVFSETVQKSRVWVTFSQLILKARQGNLFIFFFFHVVIEMPLQNCRHLFANLGRRKFYTTGARVWGERC